MTISTSGVYERARASGSRIDLFVDDHFSRGRQMNLGQPFRRCGGKFADKLYG